MAPAPWPRHGGHKADLGHGRSHGMSHGVTGLPVTQKGGQQLPSQKPTLSAGGHVLRFPREEGQSPGDTLVISAKEGVRVSGLLCWRRPGVSPGATQPGRGGPRLRGGRHSQPWPEAPSSVHSAPGRPAGSGETPVVRPTGGSPVWKEKCEATSVSVVCGSRRTDRAPRSHWRCHSVCWRELLTVPS